MELPSSFSRSERVTKQLLRWGGAIRGIPSVQLGKISVHLIIQEDRVEILGTSEGIFLDHVPTCALIPHCTRLRGKDDSFVEDLGRRVGEALSQRGLRGYASVDMVIFMNPNFDENLLICSGDDEFDVEMEDGIFAALRSAEALCIDRSIDNVEDHSDASRMSNDDVDNEAMKKKHYNRRITMVGGSRLDVVICSILVDIKQ